MTKKQQRLNAKFNKASPEKKRVLIAEDVLAQLSAKKVTPVRMSWAIMDFKLKPDGSEQVCEVMDSAKCSACALGALMLSEVRFNNALKLRELDAYDDEPNRVYFAHGFMPSGDRLENFFDYEQLAMIEIAYELGEGEYNAFTEERAAALKLGQLYKSNRNRMKAIMRNIITNKGTFIP